ncbi:putative ankyrin repeat-containing domain, PGG domain, retrotransposon Copia-like protein [Helianthus annuus]|nr:putative ankyrin repeat-containing domain, PGG domain, retrotransposon Copia-like protein [Helianthus annuus]
MASSSISAITKGSQQYPFPSSLNAAASFVSIKLSGKHNYAGWQEQMRCLLDSHDMLGFIDGGFSEPMECSGSKRMLNIPAFEATHRKWKRSDTLVKGWIFGSLSEDVMETVVGLQTAYAVWKKLETNYNTPPAEAPAPIAKANATSGKKSVGEYSQLCRAIQQRNLPKTKELLRNDSDALIDVLNVDGERALHLAILESHEDKFDSSHHGFLKKLLHDIKDSEILPSLVNNKQQNALHYAAMLGDKRVAEMLVKRNPHLLFCVDSDKYLPITRAAFHSHKATFTYLLKECRTHIKLSEKDRYHNPFIGENGVLLITTTICSGFLDDAYSLLQEHPELATLKVPGTMGLLWCIAQKWDAYPSGKRYNIYQRFVYRNIVTKDRRNYACINSFNSHDEIRLTYMEKYVYPVANWIYVRLWRLAIQNDDDGVVPHITKLHEEKVKHNRAFMILKRICVEVSKLKSGTSDHYGDAFLVAMENDTPEVLSMIIETFPQSMWTSDVNGYTVSQISIMNRCEKVYNLLVNMMVLRKFSHKSIIDKDGNNLLHLVGKLAPPHKINRVTGGALQMQKELQWFQEVREILRPEDMEERNKNKETPMMVFRKEHKDLRQKAAITVPGGNNGETGQATYRESLSFIIFVVSNAISLFTSTTALLLFLSILTARYADDDFLYKLPKRLIFGLVMLFISVSAMMIAFSASLYINFEHDKPWVLIPIAALTCLPIASFATLQLPLLVVLITSTYGRGIFRRSMLKIEAAEFNDLVPK